MSRIKALLAELPLLQPDDSLPPPLKKFTIFNRLLIELRVKIWGMAAAERRIIRLVDTKKTPLNYWKSSVTGQTRHPAILHTNHEAREEGLRYYKLCYEKTKVVSSSILKTNPGGPLISNMLYINFSKDVFHYELDREFQPRGWIDDFNLSRICLQRIQHLEILSWYPYSFSCQGKAEAIPSPTNHMTKTDLIILGHWRHLLRTDVFKTLRTFTVLFGRRNMAFRLESLMGDLSREEQKRIAKGILTTPYMNTKALASSINIDFKWKLLDTVDLPPTWSGQLKDAIHHPLSGEGKQSAGKPYDLPLHLPEFMNLNER